MALTLTTEQEIKTAAGKGASTDITLSSNWLIQIGETAEGYLCAETRRDWITDYASVNARVKKMVSKAVAALAGFEVAGYSPLGYLQLREQETKFDTLIDIYNKSVAILSKLDGNSMRGVND